MLYPQQNGARNKLDLSGIWDFKLDPEGVGEDEGWYNGLPDSRPMAVPGSWNEQYEELFNYLSLAWYVTRTYVPNSWQGERIFIRVGSACYLGTVYVNGVKVGSHEGGHLPFAFEISDHVRWGEENVIAISVENELQPTRVPSGNVASPLGGGMLASNLATTFDFFPFAGLHRPVLLYSLPQTYIDDLTVKTTIAGTDGTVHVAVSLNIVADLHGRATLSDATTTLETEVVFTAGKAQLTFEVPNARFWSDTDPHLYSLTIKTDDDCYTLPVGIRTVAVEGGKILLNGKAVKLNGFGRHEDFIASGKGLNLPLMVKDYDLMRWTGANSYRTSHYPYSEEEMMLADREGFLIIDEIPAVSLQFESDEMADARLKVCRQQLDELVTRDKNHPSVLMWCVANEPLPASLRIQELSAKSEDASIPRGRAFLETLLRRARELDPTRLVTLVGVMGGPTEWMHECDVICLNRYWGWYVLGGQMPKALATMAQELDRTWETFGRPIIMTEFGADTMAGMHGHPAVMWTEEYQAEYIRGHLEVAERKEFVAGMQVWNFADFAAVQSIMRVGGLNMKGVFTRSRQPKMAAHVLREFWVK